MHFRITNWLFLIIFMFAAVNGFSQEKTLEQYIQEALDNNPQIQSAKSRYEAAMQVAPQVSSLPDPEISAGYFLSPVETRVGPQQARLGVRQMFPWFGTLSAKGDAALQQAQASYEQYVDTRQKAIFQVKKRWYQLYRIKTAIQITQQHLEILEQYQSISTVKFETGHKSGKSGMVDVLRIDMEKEDLKNRLQLLNDDKEAKRTAFNALLDKEEDTPVSVLDSLGPNPLPLQTEQLLDSMLTKHPTLSTLEYQEKAWQAKREAAKKEGLPSVGVGFDYILVGTPGTAPMGEGGPTLGKDAAMFPMVTVKLPIYRGKYKSKVSEAYFQQEAARQSYQNQKNQLRTMFAESYKNYKDATRSIQHYQSQVKKAKQALDILMTNYQTAGRDFEEVLRMERKVLQYRLELEKAFTAQHVAVAYLEYLYGRSF